VYKRALYSVPLLPYQPLNTVPQSFIHNLVVSIRQHSKCEICGFPTGVEDSGLIRLCRLVTVYQRLETL
jgi:hypothetical protein